MYETHRAGLLHPSWEHDQDLQHHRLHILRYWMTGKLAYRASTDNYSSNFYIVRFLDDPGPIKIDLLLPSYHTTSLGAVHGSWCPQRHQAGEVTRGVLRNAAGAPRSPPYPLLVCREIGANHGFSVSYFVCVFAFFASCGTFLVYYSTITSRWFSCGAFRAAVTSSFHVFAMAFLYPCFYVSPHFAIPFLVLLYPRTCVPSTKIQSVAGILQCTCLFSVRMSPFLVLHYPRPCVPSTKIQSLAGILHCTCLFSVRMLPFLEPL